MNSKHLSSSSFQDNAANNYISLFEIVQTALQKKWLILFFSLFASILAFIYAYGQAPTYKADALLRVEPQKAAIPGLDDLASFTGNDTSVGTELELIKSRKNIAKTVRALKLDIIAKPKRIRLLGNLYKRFFSPNDTAKPPKAWKKWAKLDKVNAFIDQYAWGNEIIKVDQLNVPKEWLNTPLSLRVMEGNSYDVIFDNRVILKGKVGKFSKSKDYLFSIFVSRLRGLPNTKFSITKLSMRRAIRNLQNSIKAAEKGRKTGIISLSLIGKNEETIVEVLNKVSNTYVKQNKMRSSEEASNALTFLEEQIKPVKKEVDETDAYLSQYRIRNKTANLPQETQAILNVIVSIDTELQKIALTREELKQKYATQHPVIQSLNSQENKLKLRKAKTQAKIVKLPKTQQKLLKLERNSKVANTTYIELLNKIQEFKIAKASTVGNAYIVDNADIDESFVMPNKPKILIIGTLLGAILGIMIVFLRNALRHNTVNNPEKLEEATGLPVYATVPLSKRVSLTRGIKNKHRRQKKLLAAEYMSDPAIESLRSLRTSLHFALHEAKNNIVLITGPSPNIGKSFISSNFAAVIANSDQRVVLIDADMRKGYLHKIFKLKQTPGLAEIITEQVSYDDAITNYQSNNIKFDIITRGKTPPNPSELLMNNNFEKLLNYLSKNYDLVLIDSPPVLVVTDSSIIGNHAGVIFMVIYSNLHSLQEIEYAVSRLAQTGVETKGFIFNGFESQKSGYGYGYGYGYGSYYGE